jgi:hypothetical protein
MGPVSVPIPERAMGTRGAVDRAGRCRWPPDLRAEPLDRRRPPRPTQTRRSASVRLGHRPCVSPHIADKLEDWLQLIARGEGVDTAPANISRYAASLPPRRVVRELAQTTSVAADAVETQQAVGWSRAHPQWRDDDPPFVSQQGCDKPRSTLRASAVVAAARSPPSKSTTFSPRPPADSSAPRVQRTLRRRRSWRS